MIEIVQCEDKDKFIIVCDRKALEILYAWACNEDSLSKDITMMQGFNEKYAGGAIPLLTIDTGVLSKQDIGSITKQFIDMMCNLKKP